VDRALIDEILKAGKSILSDTLVLQKMERFLPSLRDGKTTAAQFSHGQLITDGFLAVRHKDKYWLVNGWIEGSFDASSVRAVLSNGTGELRTA
jgi:hypothetical protein